MSRDASPEPPATSVAFGQRVKILRTRRGLTREQFGGLLGKSGSWTRAIEEGRLKTPGLETVLRMADLLHVRDLSDLTGDQSVRVALFTGPGHARLAAVKASVDALALAPTRAAPPTAHLRARLDQAWAARHCAPDHRTVIGDLLPDLIRDAQLAVRQADTGADRRAAQALLGEVFALTQFFVAYQPDAPLLWRVADRGMVAAQDSEDPHAIGVAAWMAAQAHRERAHFDAADAVTGEALAFLRPLLPDAAEGVVAIAGALTYEAGYTAARRARTGTAWRYWDQAREIASRLAPGYFHPITSFGQAIMGAHAVTIAVELRAGGESVRQASAADAGTIPSRPRRARHRIEEARAYQLDGQPEVALATLEKAHAAAPDTIAYNGYAKTIILEEAESRVSQRRRRASELAVKVGILAA
ncbi:helix-turn-helix transcriptional regulator [Streptomyces sp. NBC_00122]|uniref:helix-turn-helix domain-containing protein n=1 Tax=Streptomyces sp. NBC_00122 TaxID=2903623 RepID=UPI002F91133D